MSDKTAFSQVDNASVKAYYDNYCQESGLVSVQMSMITYASLTHRLSQGRRLNLYHAQAGWITIYEEQCKNFWGLVAMLFSIDTSQIPTVLSSHE